MCGACSAQRLVIPGLDLQKPERVCTTCYSKLSAFYKIAPESALESPPQSLAASLPGSRAQKVPLGDESSEDNSGAESLSCSAPTTPVRLQQEARDLPLMVSPRKQNHQRPHTQWRLALVPSPGSKAANEGEHLRWLAARAKRQTTAAETQTATATATATTEEAGGDKAPVVRPSQRDFLQQRQLLLQQQQKEQEQEQQGQQQQEQQEEKNDSDCESGYESEDESTGESAKPAISKDDEIERLRKLLRAKDAEIERLTARCHALEQQLAQQAPPQPTTTHNTL